MNELMREPVAYFRCLLALEGIEWNACLLLACARYELEPEELQAAYFQAAS